MKRKIAIFAFRGESMCFAHALLNTLDLHEKGHDVKLIIEGSAVKEIGILPDSGKPFSNLYARAKELNLIDCVCKACATQLGSIESVKQQQLPICDQMMGHAPMTPYIEEGYEIIVL